jgi:integrase
MHYHDLRHTHKTWLIEDYIPKVAQAKRLGHRYASERTPKLTMWRKSRKPVWAFDSGHQAG